MHTAISSLSCKPMLPPNPSAEPDFRPLNADLLLALLLECPFSGRPPVILCIGTDRLIGDSLGPFVGTLLEKASDTLIVYGTLQHTVHAQNLSGIMADIKKKHPGNPVIAIDASFGPYSRIGSVGVRPGALQPGAGCSKKLPCAGDISITGIIAADGSHPYLSLQTVRLSMILRMAESISECVIRTCDEIRQIPRQITGSGSF